MSNATRQRAEGPLSMSTTVPTFARNGAIVLRRPVFLETKSTSCRSVQCRAAAPQSTKLDSSMIWGDIMMLTATELASERLPKQVTGVLSLTLLAAWIGVATAKGDYTVKRQHTFSYQYVYGILLGMQQAAITWLLFVPTAMAMYACLVSHHLLDSSVFRVPAGAHVSPEGEVMIASLFTLMSWRGIYSSQMF